MLHSTKGDLPDALRRNVIALMNRLVADALDRTRRGQQAPWNGKGPSFIALHELFAKVSEGLVASSDDVADGITARGGFALGTVQVVAKESHLPKHSTALVMGRGQLEALSGSVDDLGDVSHAELFTQVARDAHKLLSLFETHLQASE